MLSFKHHIVEGVQELSEKLITFAGKAYPKFGNVVILAGGAGSGKGFVKEKLVGIEGYSFDVDELKKLASAAPSIQKRMSDEHGIDIAKLASNLKDPENVGKLHDVVSTKLNLDNRRQQALFTSILTAPQERKPNLIFDVTLKDFRKLDKIVRNVTEIGYAKANIHIVWIVNDIEVAVRQNAARDRVVPAEILVNTHRGASQTMQDIINMGKGITKYMDGDIVFAFNKVDVDKKVFDNHWEARDTGNKEKGRAPDPRTIPSKNLRAKGMYAGQDKYKGGRFKTAEYFYVKRAGKAPQTVEEISKDIRRKIASYVPKNVSWV